jgi:hypothetical protein
LHICDKDLLKLLHPERILFEEAIPLRRDSLKYRIRAGRRQCATGDMGNTIRLLFNPAAVGL